MWDKVLQHVQDFVQQQKDNASSGDRQLHWTTKHTKDGLQLKTRRIYAHIGGIDALCVDPEGFVGIFKQYRDPHNNLREIIRDLYYLAQFRHEEAIEIGMMTDNGIVSSLPTGDDNAKPPERLWKYHLFAGLAAHPKVDDLKTFATDLYDGRLTEEIGLSLFFPPNETAADDILNDEITKFAAPLLLQLRKWREQDPFGEWRSKLMGRLRQLFTPVSGPEDVHSLDATAYEHLQRAIGHVLHPSEDTVRPNVRMRRMDNIGIRRFAKLSEPLPFGAITLVHGPNGSGKTSLLDGIELALTGRIQRIDDALENFGETRTEKASRGETYSHLLTPMTRKAGEISDDTPSDPSLGDIKQFGAIAVQTDEGSEGDNLISLPMRYEPISDSAESESINTGVRSFYLAQGDLKRFVTAQSEDRYGWMTEVANVPLEAVQESIKSLRAAVQKESGPRWQQLTNGTLRANTSDAYKKAAEQVQNIFTSEEKRVENIVTGLEHCSTHLATGGHLPEWFLKATNKLPDLKTVQNQYATDWSVVAEIIATRNISTTDKEKLETALDRIIQETPTIISLENSLRSVHNKIQNMVDGIADIVPEIDRRLPATKAADETSTDPSPAEQPARGATSKDRRTLEVEGQTIAAKTMTATHARRNAQTMSELVRHIDDTLRQLAPLPNPKELTWANHAKNAAGRYKDLHARITPILQHLNATTEHLSWLDDEVQYWKDTEERFVQERTKWAAAMRALAGKDAGKPGPLPPELSQRLANFLSEAGHVELAKQFVHTSDDIPTLEKVRSIIGAYIKISNNFIESARKSDEYQDLEQLDELLRDWHRVDEDLERCGLGTLLHYMDVANGKEKEILKIISEEMEELLTTSVGDLWVELVGALTAHLWNYPLPRFKMKGGGQRKSMVIEADLGTDKPLPADAVFNMGELHVLGLAWFLLSYMLEGIRYSDTMILDDPFQSLDDANVSTVVRNLLEIIRLGDIQQVVLALHQPGIVDYIRQEVATPWHLPTHNNRTNGSSTGKSSKKGGRARQQPMTVAEWIVEPVDAHRSRVTPKLHLLRSGAQGLPPMLSSISLPGLGTRVNGTQSHFSDSSWGRENE